MHYGEQRVVPERLVAFEPYLRDFQVLPADLGSKEARANNDEDNTIEGPVLHPDIKKKPSHETLGSILAFSFVNEANLTSGTLRSQYSLSSSKKKSSSVG